MRAYSLPSCPFFATLWTVAHLSMGQLLCPQDSLGKNTGVDAVPSSSESSCLRDRTGVSCVSLITGRFFTTEPLGKSQRFNTYF